MGPDLPHQDPSSCRPGAAYGGPSADLGAVQRVKLRSTESQGRARGWSRGQGVSAAARALGAPALRRPPSLQKGANLRRESTARPLPRRPKRVPCNFNKNIALSPLLPRTGLHARAAGGAARRCRATEGGAFPQYGGFWGAFCRRWRRRRRRLGGRGGGGGGGLLLGLVLSPGLLDGEQSTRSSRRQRSAPFPRGPHASRPRFRRAAPRQERSPAQGRPPPREGRGAVPPRRRLTTVLRPKNPLPRAEVELSTARPPRSQDSLHCPRQGRTLRASVSQQRSQVVCVFYFLFLCFYHRHPLKKWPLNLMRPPAD